MRDLPNLDFLRSCAVLSVVLEHVLLALHIMKLGYVQVAWVGVVGVFLFFVHTTLVLMWSLERKPHTLDFYIRRIFRLYPLALVAMAAVLLWKLPGQGTPVQYFAYVPPNRMLQLVGSVFLSWNLFGGYLPLNVMWSLPYEVQMYLFLPMLFFFVQRNFSRWPVLLLWCFWVAVCRQIFRDVPHNFFVCVPYFLPGVLAYIGFGRSRARISAWLFPPALALAWAVFLLKPGWRAADFLCLAVGLGLPLFRQIAWKPLIAASHTVAKYSYGIYLAHPFGLVLGIYLLPHTAVAVQIAIALASTALLAVGGYHLIEHPMIRLGSRLARWAEKRYEQHELAQYRIPEAEIR